MPGPQRIRENSPDPGEEILNFDRHRPIGKVELLYLTRRKAAVARVQV